MPDSAKNLPDELDDLARQLRQGAGHELREEAAENEQLTELQRRRRLGLAEASRTAMHRGDRVTASVGGVSFSHPVIAVGEDYLTMEDVDRWIDIRLADAVLTIHPRPTGGRSGHPSAPTFRARLGEHEQEGTLVEVTTRDGDRRAGRVEVLGADHLVLVGADDQRTYLPLGAVVAVLSRFPPRRSRDLQTLPHPPGPLGGRG